MAGENSIAKELVANAMQAAAQNPKQDKDAMGRALINAVIGEYAQYRKAADIASELKYLADNLDEDEFVITRGC